MTVPARMSIVSLGVADLGRAIAFYEALGWEKAASSNPEIAWFRTADSYLGLFPLAELAKDAAVEPPPEPRPFAGVTLAINVETEEAVGAALDAAVTAGATLLKPPTRADWGGLSGYFSDPDGHAWEVAHNPFFPIDAAGRIRID
jgi:catechol 2,3-dioxygenase-like lactoylglutathione lyase family enzyme